MRILIYTLHYYPDLIGIAKYNQEMCEWLSDKEHEITVVTGKPFYPEWKYKSKRKWYKREKINGVNIARCPIYIPSNPTPLKKIIHELSFV